MFANHRDGIPDCHMDMFKHFHKDSDVSIFLPNPMAKSTLPLHRCKPGVPDSSVLAVMTELVARNKAAEEVDGYGGLPPRPQAPQKEGRRTERSKTRRRGPEDRASNNHVNSFF